MPRSASDARPTRTAHNAVVTRIEPFLDALRPLLDEQSAHGARIFGSHARGTAAPESDIDVIIVAPTERSFVDRFREVGARQSPRADSRPRGAAAG